MHINSNAFSSYCGITLNVQSTCAVSIIHTPWGFSILSGPRKLIRLQHFNKLKIFFPLLLVDWPLFKVFILFLLSCCSLVFAFYLYSLKGLFLTEVPYICREEKLQINRFSCRWFFVSVKTILRFCFPSMSFL